jgi:hypothetical protein
MHRYVCMADAADVRHRFPNVCDVDFFWEL